MSLNIYGTGLDGIKSVKDYMNTRVRQISENVSDSLRATPEQQEAILAEMQQLRHDQNFVNSMAKIMTNLIKDINP